MQSAISNELRRTNTLDQRRERTETQVSATKCDENARAFRAKSLVDELALFARWLRLLFVSDLDDAKHVSDDSVEEQVSIPDAIDAMLRNVTGDNIADVCGNTAVLSRILLRLDERRHSSKYEPLSASAKLRLEKMLTRSNFDQSEIASRLTFMRLENMNLLKLLNTNQLVKGNDFNTEEVVHGHPKAVLNVLWQILYRYGDGLRPRKSNKSKKNEKPQHTLYMHDVETGSEWDMTDNLSDESSEAELCIVRWLRQAEETQEAQEKQKPTVPTEPSEMQERGSNQVQEMHEPQLTATEETKHDELDESVAESSMLVEPPSQQEAWSDVVDFTKLRRKRGLLVLTFVEAAEEPVWLFASDIPSRWRRCTHGAVSPRSDLRTNQRKCNWHHIPAEEVVRAVTCAVKESQADEMHMYGDLTLESGGKRHGALRLDESVDPQAALQAVLGITEQQHDH
ncbi:MAG: hypothetical protein MHM6MM_006869 [Cercozoa sp. M6MM]